MQELVFMQSLQDEPYTTPEVIAEHTGIEYRSISDLIRRNKSDLEFFGVLRFEIVKLTSKKGGRPKKVYHLNEQQATTLITFLDNTPQVKAFKVALVAEFFKLRDEKAKWKVQRLSEKPKKHHYIKVNSIANKAIAMKYGYPKAIKKDSLRALIVKCYRYLGSFLRSQLLLGVDDL